MYSYNVAGAVEDFDSRYTEVTTVPIGDCEPPYDSSGHYTGDVGQQLRERTASVFIRGGVFYGLGDMQNWWTFGASNPPRHRRPDVDRHPNARSRFATGLHRPDVSPGWQRTRRGRHRAR